MSSGTQSPAGGEVAVVGPVAVPNDVRASFVLWLAAVAAGVFETILAIIAALTSRIPAIEAPSEERESPETPSDTSADTETRWRKMFGGSG